MEAYKKEEINIDFLTVQNEPNACQRWESCKYTLEELKELQDIVLEKLKNTKILGWDHNKENLLEVADQLLLSNISGLAFHSYMGTHSTNLHLVSKKYPNAILFHTEGCCGYSKYNEKNWISDAEYYMINMLSDINHGLNGYIDWNILLDYNGGPSHKENYCKSPLILNRQGIDFIKTPIYYYLCHIGKFIHAGFSIIPLDIYRPDLFGVAAKGDNKIVVTLLNVNNQEIEIDLVIEQTRVHDKLKPHSIVTYLNSST